MKLYLCCVLFLISVASFAVPTKNDVASIGLKTEGFTGKKGNSDTSSINRLIRSASGVFKSNPDSTIYFATKSLALSQEFNYQPGIGYSLVQLGRANLFIGNLEIAKTALNHAIAIFTRIDDKNGLIESYMFYGAMFNYQSDYKSSVKYLSLALNLAKATKNNLKIGECYQQFGLTYFIAGKLSLSLDSYYRALFIYLNERDQTQIASIYNKIGDILQNLEEYPKALEYYKKALAEAVKINNVRQIGNANENIGEIKLAQKNFDEALTYLLKGIKISKAMGNKADIGYISADLGLCYGNKGQFDVAKTYLDSSLSLAWQDKMLYDEAFATISYATVLNLQHKYKDAAKYALRGQTLAIQSGNIWFLTNDVRELYKSYAGQRNFESAFKYSNQYNELKDSLKNTEGIQKLTTYSLILNFNEKQHQFETHQRQADVSYRQKIKQEKLNLTFILIIVVMGIIAASYYIQKNRQHKTILAMGEKNAEILQQKNSLDEQTNKLNNSNELKDSLIGILAHDLRAPLSTLNGLFALLVDDTINHEEMLAMVPPVVKQLEYTSDFLDTLLFWINSQVENAGNAAKKFYLHEIVCAQVSSHQEQAKAKGINLFETVPDDLVVFADPDYIKIVIRNLIGNALKFSEKEDTIEVTALVQNDEENGEDFCLIEIKDTGVGMSEEKAKKLFNEKVNSSKGTNNEKGSGMAMLFCRDLIEKCKGKIWVTSIEGRGTQFNFTLPMLTVVEPARQTA